MSLVLFGLHLVVLGIARLHLAAWFPKLIDVLLVVAGVGYLVDSFGYLLLPDYSAAVGAFTFIGELLLGLWLVARGGRMLRVERPDLDADGRHTGAGAEPSLTPRARAAIEREQRAHLLGRQEGTVRGGVQQAEGGVHAGPRLLRAGAPAGSRGAA